MDIIFFALIESNVFVCYFFFHHGAQEEDAKEAEAQEGWTRVKFRRKARNEIRGT